MKEEMIPIVNDNNELIHYKKRSDFDEVNDICQSASIFVYKKDAYNNMSVLIAQRSFNKRFAPGKYAEAVGGTVNKYNEYIQTAIREAEEEIGVKLTEDQLITGLVQRLNEPSKTIIQWFIAEINQPIEYFNIQAEELERIDWISLGSLENDIIQNPNKYIVPMADIVKIIKPYLT